MVSPLRVQSELANLSGHPARGRKPLIAIEIEPFGYGYDVRVVPVPTGIGHDREFRTKPEAACYAALLARATGWPVIDNASRQHAG